MRTKLMAILCTAVFLLSGVALTGEAAKKSTKKSSYTSSAETYTWAAGEKTPQHTISINPVAPILLPYFPIEYEYTLSPKNTVAGRIGFGGYSIGTEWSTTIISFGGSYRFFLLKDTVAPSGLYVGPAVDLEIVSASYDSYDYVWNPVTFTYDARPVKESGSSLFVLFGGEAGYEWVFKNLFDKGVHLTLTPSVFLGYMIGSLDVGGASLGLGGFSLGLGGSVGVAF